MVTANEITVNKYVSKEWTGFILLPTVRAIAGAWVAWLRRPLTVTYSSVDCVTAVNVSVKDQLTLSSAVAIGSTIVSGLLSAVNPQSRFLESPRSAWTTPGQQLSLFVIPLMVIVAWITGFPLGLLFDPFESVALYLAGMHFLEDVM